MNKDDTSHRRPLPRWIVWAVAFFSAAGALALQAWDTRMGGSMFRTLDLESIGLERIGNSFDTVAWLLYYSTLTVVLALTISAVVVFALKDRVIAQRSMLLRALTLAGLAGFVQVSIHALAAWLFPTLPTVEFARLLLGTPLGPVVLSAGLLLFASCGVLALAQASRRARWSVTALVLGMSLFSVDWPASTSVTKPSAAPHVILIGLDSFRPDLLLLGQGDSARSITPSIRSIVEESRVFPDATTPFPRTFPATVSVMTGRWPYRHGARENLFGEHRVSLRDTLGARLSDAGYQTMFGMDEVRFANITQGYGYEHFLSPRDGIVDFVAEAMASAAPLALLANAPPMRRLAPHIYGNRALTAVYSPEAFVRRVRGGIAGRDGRPLFLHLHLTLPHWPYREDGAEEAKRRWASLAEEGFRPAYLRSLEELDAQFAEILGVLRDEELLDDAIVLLYSDHGQSFSLARDTFMAPDGPTGAFDGFGHGSSIVSPGQVDVLFALQRFAQGEPTIASGLEPEVPASLVDIAPTLLRLAGLGASPDMDGSALWPLLPEERLAFAGRARIYEGPFPLVSINTAHVDIREVLQEAVARYALSRSGERVEFRDASIPMLMEAKHRAVEFEGWALLRYRVGGVEVRESLVHRPTRRVWPSAPFPDDAPYARLSATWCSTWADNVSWIDERCRASSR